MHSTVPSPQHKHWGCTCTQRQHSLQSAQLCQLLTALRTITILCAVGDLLLADAVLVCFAISAWASADASFKTSAAQDLPTGERGERKCQMAAQMGASSIPQLHTRLCTDRPKPPIAQSGCLRCWAISTCKDLKNILWPFTLNCSKEHAMVPWAENEPEGNLSSKGLHSGYVTYSLVSSVTMMRIGRRFIPPTQLLLHMKLYKTVVNSVPTWMRQKGWAEGMADGELCFLQALLLYFHSCASSRLAWSRPHHKAFSKEFKNSCSQEMKRVFKSSSLMKRKKGFIVMRMGKAQDPESFS